MSSPNSMEKNAKMNLKENGGQTSEEIVVNLDEAAAKKYEAFFSIYKHQKSIFTDIEQKEFIGSREKKCRFCGKSSPEVKFKNDAHLIPQSIGNRYLLVNFECDKCNHFFGEKYEQSFANFFSLFRTFARVENQNKRKWKATKFRGPDTGFEIIPADKGMELYWDSKGRDVVDLNREILQLTLSPTKPPYVPLFVYKTFYKIALSMIDDSELEEFKRGFFFLRDNEQNVKLKNSRYCQMFETFIPGPPIWPKPFGLLHTKLDSAKNLPNPEKMFTLYFSNKMYQMFLPLCERDDFLIGRKFTILQNPPPIDVEYSEKFGKPQTIIIDLSSDAVVRDAKEQVRFEFDSIEPK